MKDLVSISKDHPAKGIRLRTRMSHSYVIRNDITSPNLQARKPCRCSPAKCESIRGKSPRYTLGNNTSLYGITQSQTVGTAASHCCRSFRRDQAKFLKSRFPYFPWSPLITSHRTRQSRRARRISGTLKRRSIRRLTSNGN